MSTGTSRIRLWAPRSGRPRCLPVGTEPANLVHARPHVGPDPIAHAGPQTGLRLGYLIAVLAAPLAGPLLYRAFHERPEAARLVDGFVYVAVPVLVALQVLPAAWASRSLAVIAALLVGLAIPTIAEKLSHALHRHTDTVAMLVGLSGLFLHTLLEGAALVPGSEGVQIPFTLAVVVHQVPVGLVIWWLIQPRYGSGLALAGVASISIGTLAGYALGVEVLGAVHGESAKLYQALVAGSLVHVVFHQGRQDHTHGVGHAHGPESGDPGSSGRRSES